MFRIMIIDSDDDAAADDDSRKRPMHMAYIGWYFLTMVDNGSALMIMLEN